MTYSPNIPQGNSSPANQVTGMQTNFSTFASVFDNNHVALNLANQGDHIGMILQNQSSDPAVGESNIVLYAKNATSKAGTQPQLFIKVPQFLPNIKSLPMQLTYNTVNTTGPVYQSFLPGGYIFYFGNSSLATSPTLITLSPQPTKILMALAETNSVLGGLGGGIPISTRVVNNFTFNVYASSACNFSWMAIAQA